MKMMTIAKAAALVLAIGAPAGAATLDFSGLPAGQVGNPLRLSNATLTSGGDDIFHIVGEGVCAFNLAYDCQADLDIAFRDRVSNLSFRAFGHDPGDYVLAQAFDGAGALLASFGIEGDGVYGFGGLSGIRRVLFADGSTGAGYSWGEFDFAATPVPLPGALPLLLGGVAAGALALRRRKA